MSGERYALVYLYVSGRVQGVGFRFFTINRAHKYGVTIYPLPSYAAVPSF